MDSDSPLESPHVHVSASPMVQAKVSQLRAAGIGMGRTRALTAQLATLLAAEALGPDHFEVAVDGAGVTPLGEQYNELTVVPGRVVLVPVLRSGLAMVDATLDVLPLDTVPIHYLGLFRDKDSLEPIEYYNKLPELAPGDRVDVAVVLDPVVATGGTAAAVIQSLREWGARKVILITILASEEGIARTLAEWPEGVHIYCGVVDAVISTNGMVLPGVGDIGDRLNRT
ncbi:uracil phosphoribosyltransferase-domain-containing protein [Dipodascopsis tothii]|uniref:uracil phosphoribosyltransferase-domain-containing protein n=1 Tax=Dipodascopsis tothii TaxID=44089 RepID=UPI0034CDE5FD